MTQACQVATASADQAKQPAASEQQPEEINGGDPFNHYNTEFVKLDANQWLDDVDGSRMIHLEGLQFGLLSKSERQAELFAKLAPDSVNNKSFTDVTFIVGPPQHSKKYVGHRVLLAMTSPVFETLFYGDMADKNKYIRIADVAPIGFENLLRFAYTDSLNLSSVQDAMLTAYAAKKYLLPQLLRECLQYIEQNMTNSSACVVFEFAQVLNSQQLVLNAIQLIDRQTQSVISKKSFMQAQPSTVEFLANRKYLTIRSEYALFGALLTWSLAEYGRRSSPSSSQEAAEAEDTAPIDWLQVRAIMLEHNLLQACRFLAMTQEEFARCIAKSSSTIVSHKRALQASSQETTSQQEVVADEQAGELDENADGSSRPCVITESSNSLLSQAEQRAIFMNLALANSAQVPVTLSVARDCRQAPPESFALNRLATTGGKLVTTMTSTRSIHGVHSKFQCLNENVFITALTIPIRLDPSSYINKTPKFECHLKFTTRPAALGGDSGPTATATSRVAPGSLDAATAISANFLTGAPLEGVAGSAGQTVGALMMDSVDESLHISISREKDCFVRLKRPILIRMGNVNEILITFQNYALDEDVALKMLKPASKQASNLHSEIRDEENIRWLFFKTSSSSSPPTQLNIELSELHYYY